MIKRCFTMTVALLGVTVSPGALALETGYVETAPGISIYYETRGQVARASGNNFEAAHRLAAAIPGAELAIVEGGRHLFLWEVPEQVTPVVADFFARH